MKNKDLKKGRESIIGKIIYGFLLFMPLIAIGVTCGYAMFNKNAYKSYSDINVKSVNKLSTTATLYSGAEYQFTYNNDTSNINIQKIFYTDINIDWVDYGANSAFDYKGFAIAQYSGSLVIYLYETDTAPLSTLTNVWGNTLQNFTITKSNLQILGGQTFYNVFQIITTQNGISDVFYYSVDKVEQSELFNWAENSLIYTGIENTCTQLSITNTFIPLLLAYWLIISVIYILYDIILMILIILHNKIHQIQDSI